MHGAAHIAEHAAQLIGQGLLVCRTDDAVTLHQNQRLYRVSTTQAHTPGRQQLALRVARHAHQRVNNPVRGTATAVDGHGDRVHQKRHVGVNNLDDRVVTYKPVFSQCGVEYAHLGALWDMSGIQQAPVRVGNGIQRSRAA